MNDVLRMEQHGAVAVVSIVNPPVNALSREVRTRLCGMLTALEEDASVRAVVLRGGGRMFSAGADIGEFQQGGAAMFAGRDPLEITSGIDSMTKPVIAAIHGSALGGGLELALGCHYRIATAHARMGLTEILLGVLPGAGGTQRLPRLVGCKNAADLMLTGRAADGSEALRIGLVDTLVEGDLTTEAVAFANKVLEGATGMRRVRDLPPATSIEAADLARIVDTASKKRGQRQAALKIAECVEASTRLGFDEGVRFERERFVACNSSEAAAALQHGFFARREAQKSPDIPAGTEPRRVDKVGILGGGTMGRGIAMAFANAGIPVELIEVDRARAELARGAVDAEYGRLATAGKLTDSEAVLRAGSIQLRTGYDQLASCDLVIEAVFEDLQVKLQVARELGARCRPGAIIASNTSTLDIDLLAAASGRARDFVGMHFFSPANVMRLLEIVRGKETSPDVLATVLGLARRLGKDPVVSGVCWGFIGNRMLEPYLREAEALLLEGASPRQIDDALEQFGMAMGPCRMMDLAGVDVVAKVVDERAKQGALPDDPTYRIVCREMHAQGRLGQKTGQGFYRYEGRRTIEDPEAVTAIRQLAQRVGYPGRESAIEAGEIVERCLLPLINEGQRIIAEGIAYRSSDIDVVWLSGYGFPADRGGPMFYGQRLGTRHLLDRLAHYAMQQGDRYGYWAPAEGVKR